MKKWLNVFKNVRRKGKHDKFDPFKRSTLVCEFHFEITDIKVQNSKKKLRPGIVPTLKEETVKEARRPPLDRSNLGDACTTFTFYFHEFI